MLDKELLKATVADAIKETDLFIVGIRVTSQNSVTVEIDSPTMVDIDQCAEISRRIEAAFDREIEDYELEVGSAGLTAPFKVKEQYIKNIGNDVDVLTRDGRKLTGRLIEVSPEGDNFTIEVTKKVKEPGMKRPELRTEPLTLAVADTKQVKYSFKFK